MDGDPGGAASAKQEEHEDTSPRDPERGALHQILREHLATFLAEREEARAPLPKFVVKELKGYEHVDLPGTERPCGCDLRGADCPGGRCGAVESSDGTLVPARVPVLGTAGAGTPCTRDAQGIDDCTAGHACIVTATGVPPVCRPICARGSECSAGEACAAFSGTSIEGICVPRCVAFDGGCPPGTGCRLVVERGTAGATVLAMACVPGGAGIDGDPCSGIGGDCAAEYFCLAGSGGPTCQPMCDATHPCPASRTCRTPVGNSVPLSPSIQACTL